MLKYLLCIIPVSLEYADLDCINEDSKVYRAHGMRDKSFRTCCTRKYKIKNKIFLIINADINRHFYTQIQYRTNTDPQRWRSSYPGGPNLDINCNGNLKKRHSQEPVMGMLLCTQYPFEQEI